MNEIKIIIVLLLLIAALVYLILWLNNYVSKNKSSKNKFKSNIFAKSYSLLIKNKIARKYLLMVRKRVQRMDLSDSYTITIRTMQIAFCSIGISIILAVWVVCISKELYFLLAGLALIYVIHNQVFKIFVEVQENYLLRQLEKLIKAVRHHYHEHKMIDEALYDSIEESGYEIGHHAVKIYEVLTSQDIELKLNAYYELVPNKYFKTFVALCYMVQRFGDIETEGKSLFLTNLNYLKQEIEIELLKRQKLDYLFKSLSLIAVLPIFFLPLIEKWAVANLKELALYYRGEYGFLVQILLIFTVGGSFSLINRMQSSYEYDGEVTFKKTENKILQIKLIKNIIKSWINSHYSKRMRMERLLKESKSNLTVEKFYLKRFAFLLAGIFLSLMTILHSQEIKKRSIASVEEFNNIPKGKELIIDKESLKSILKSKDRQSIEEFLIQKKGFDNKTANIYSGQYIIKAMEYNKIYFKWYHLIICFAIGAVSWKIPILLLLFKKKMLVFVKEDEIMQFHTIILMLMHIERISVEDILEWMGVFSSVFKESIEKCINDFEYGDYLALEQLKNQERYSPFERIIENLQAATNSISIKQAFDELKTERYYYQEKRKQDNEIMVSKKGAYGRIIAFTPFAATIVLYLIVPFIHLSINQFIQYSNQITEYL